MKTKKIIIGELLFLFVLILVMILTKDIEWVDTKVYESIIYLRSNLFDTIFKLITKTGNTIPVTCVTVVCLLLWKKKERYMLGLSILINLLLNQILKFIIQRPRPDHLRLIEQKGFSFPSGHAMMSVALYGVLIYYIYKHVENKYLKVVGMVILSLLIVGIGCSRIYLGVHYPSDVIAGFSLALVILILVIDWCNKNVKGE